MIIGLLDILFYKVIYLSLLAMFSLCHCHIFITVLYILWLYLDWLHLLKKYLNEIRSVEILSACVKRVKSYDLDGKQVTMFSTVT